MTPHSLPAILARFFLYFAVAAAILLPGLSYLEYRDLEAQRAQQEAQEALRVSLAANALRLSLRVVVEDLRTIADAPPVIAYANDPDASNRARLEQLFLTFAQHKRIYDQVRFIELSGMEGVRVNYRDGYATVVPREDLQDRSVRYYFQRSIGLAQGEIYVSPLDLNIDHGALEVPYKPLIRVATPIFDLQGNRRGILTLNYLAGTLIGQFEEVMAGGHGHPMLVNQDGYWLSSRNRRKEWGFMFGNEVTFAREHPRAWAQMLGEGSGTVQADRGTFVFATVRPFGPDPGTEVHLSNGDPFWKVIVWMPGKNLWQELAASAREQSGSLALLLAIVAMLSFLAARWRVANLQKERQLWQTATVFENTTDGVFMTDASARILTVNRAFSEITGYTLEEVRGRNPRFLQSARQTKDFYLSMLESLRKTGQWRGEIWHRRKNGEIYPAWQNINAITDKRGRLTNYISIFSDISAIKRSEERLREMAHHDPLTGLPNRLLFSARLGQALERARRHGQRVALLFLDLDRFKYINDTLGHAAGDALLREIGRRLATCVRAEDTVARLGGDEFTIILEEVRDAQDVASLAEKILAAVGRPVTVEGKEVVTSTSIGISLYPDDGENGEALAKAADTAMYRAKEQGRQNYRFYTADLTEKALEHLSLENGLRRALERGELALRYQPQVAMADGRIVGVEALLVWQHPDMGPVPPDKFIPVAEDTGLIHAIGDWVLREVCRDALSWRAAGLPPLRMALNISMRQIAHDHFLTRTRDVLQAMGLQPGELDLELEITESALQTAGPDIEVLRDLKSLGVPLAIDDFGTGYSSLSSLKHLPIDRLKIDKSFLRGVPDDPNDTAIVSTIVAMGHNLGLKVVAEGVETEAQCRFLRARGCDEAQGYWFSPPVPPAAIRRLLEEGGTLPRLPAP